MRTYVWDGLTEVEYVSVTESFLINGEKVEREIIFPITAEIDETEKMKGKWKITVSY